MSTNTIMRWKKDNMGEKKITAMPHSSTNDYDLGVNIRDGVVTPLTVAAADDDAD